MTNTAQALSVPTVPGSSVPTVPTVQVVQVIKEYLDDLARGDLETAGRRFGDDLTFVAPGRNRLAGVRHGASAAGLWHGQMAALSDRTYRMTGAVDWLSSGTRAVLLAQEHAEIAGRPRDWLRAVVFDVADHRIHRVQLFEDDQYSYDNWVGPVSAPEAPGPTVPAPEGPPVMTGDLDDPRVRAVLSYQRQVAAGDFDNARTIFAPDVTYTVPGDSLLSGIYRGPDEVMGYLGKLFALTDNRYTISAMDWCTSADRVSLLTRNHATRNDMSLAWDELIVFTFVDGRKKVIQHFSGDQYGVDHLFG